MIPQQIFWFQKGGGGTTNIIRGLEGTKLNFGKVSPEEYVEDIIARTLLVNASRNGEIWLGIMVLVNK